MEVLGVIPARFASTRFPGKPLAQINGKPMLQWVIEASQKSSMLSSLLVATDHQEIADLAKFLGIQAVMTESDLPSGSDRVWQAVQERDFEVVVAIQGDEPLLQPMVIDALVEPFSVDAELEMATLSRSLNEEDLLSPNTAKIVVNQRDEALYFSRLAIPFSRGAAKQDLALGHKHIGLYAYRKDFLRRYCEHGPCEIEKMESLEQLRALYLGAKIKVVRVEAESWGVDTVEDVQKVESVMKERGV